MRILLVLIFGFSILAIVSLKFSLSGLYILSLGLIVATVVSFPFLPWLRRIFASRKAKVSPIERLETPRVNRDRMEQILNKEAPRFQRNHHSQFEERSSAETISPAEPEIEEQAEVFRTIAKDEVVLDFIPGEDDDVHAPFESLKKKFLRPAVYAFRPYPPHRKQNGRSRVGGLPDLPPGTGWPRAPGHPGEVKANTPLHFLAQIDLAEVPWRPEGFPSSGVLMFFGRYDEELLWATEDVDPANDFCLVFDRDYRGVRTTPPEDLAPISSATDHFEFLFGPADPDHQSVFPEWPLQFAKVATMPTASDLPFAAPKGYREARSRMIEEQLLQIFGVMEVPGPVSKEFPVFEQLPIGKTGSLSLKPFLETGFPYSIRGVSLFCRMLERRYSKQLNNAGFAAKISDWRSWAEHQSNLEISSHDAQEFIDDINAFLATEPTKESWSYLKSDIRGALHQLVEQAGGSPALAGLLPDEIYIAAATRHPIFLKDSQSSGDETLKLDRSGYPFHQMFGHLDSVQFNLPLDSPDLLLFQLNDDFGAGMPIGDGGEFDFLMKENDLADWVLDKVSAAHCGH